MAGKRIGVLGHGAFGFDSAVTALRISAAKVDMCFRRPKMPEVNLHHWIEVAGFLKHYPALDDHAKWAINQYFKKIDQPPAHQSYLNAHKF